MASTILNDTVSTFQKFVLPSKLNSTPSIFIDYIYFLAYLRHRTNLAGCKQSVTPNVILQMQHYSTAKCSFSLIYKNDILYETFFAQTQPACRLHWY